MEQIRRISCFFLLVLLVLIGCEGDSAMQTAVPVIDTSQPFVTAMAVQTATSVLPTQTIIATNTSPPNPSATFEPTETAVPLPTPTPHPLTPYTISGMRQRIFSGGEIQTRAILEQNEAYTRYYIDYPSDGLTITGIMHLPTGDGPFPVLVLLHGYIDRSRYFAGADTWQAADFFARRGYLTIAPDFRSWGESDTGLSLFHTGLVADVLNLIGSLPSLPIADSSRIGLWGHSMGGGMATKVLTIDERIDAAVLYAPNSADDADLIARWGAGCLAGESEAAGDFCNPAEVIPLNTPPDLVEAYLSAAADPEFLQLVSPLYHLENISAPVQIHIGTADGQSLVETPPEWSAKLAEGLQNANQDVAYFSYEGQGHSFLGTSWTTLLDRTLIFFNLHLKAAP